jgi:heptaprenyl diphosphate synthase
VSKNNNLNLSSNKYQNRVGKNPTAKLVNLALLIAIGLIVFIFESYIPRPLPWLKPGLANIVTLVVLYHYGFKEALVVVIIRVILGSLILGTFLSPSFILALTGGVCATIAMFGVLKVIPRVFSILGISIIGAVAHNIAQVLMLNALIVKQSELFFLLPILILSGLFAGLIVGLIGYYLLECLSRYKTI